MLQHVVCTIDGGWAGIRVGMGWIGLSSLLRTRIFQCIVRNIDNLCVETEWKTSFAARLV